MQDEWRGIAVLQAKASASGARWYMHRAVDVVSFLDSPMGQQLVQLPDAERQELTTAMLSTSPLLPAVHNARHLFVANTSLHEFSYQVILAKSGHIGI